MDQEVDQNWWKERFFFFSSPLSSSWPLRRPSPRPLRPAEAQGSATAAAVRPCSDPFCAAASTGPPAQPTFPLTLLHNLSSRLSLSLSFSLSLSLSSTRWEHAMHALLQAVQPKNSRAAPAWFPPCPTRSRRQPHTLPLLPSPDAHLWPVSFPVPHTSEPPAHQAGRASPRLLLQKVDERKRL